MFLYSGFTFSGSPSRRTFFVLAGRSQNILLSFLFFFSALFFFQSIVSHGEYAHADTIPPSLTWISPAPFSVISTNTIRVAVNARDNAGGSGIKKVEFTIVYFNFDGQPIPRQVIGEVTRYPYEIIYDCSKIPDQNMQKLSFRCTVTDHAGNTTDSDVFGRISNFLFVLDRNSQSSAARLSCNRSNQKIVLDGNLAEWSPIDSLYFTNNDNRISAYSQWNDEYLFFAVRVRDRSIISAFTPDISDYRGLSSQDVIALFLDVDHDRSEICSLPDRIFHFAAAGKGYESVYHRLGSEYRSEVNIFPNIINETAIAGTLNNESDNDAGFSTEIAISWKELGVSPGKGKTIGLEVWNADRDFTMGELSYSGWTTIAANLKNPSEWGTLVLIEDGNTFRFAFLFIPTLILAVTVLPVLYYRKTRYQAAPSDQTLSIEKECIRKARTYTLEYFSDEQIDREVVAAHVGLNSTYFGKVFKAETGVHFSDYLADLRIEKARSLLLTTSKNIAEIAFEVGFSSQSYLGYIFKKQTGVSPKQYRIQRG
ncbi:MAG: helix-turn-helix domain-containing protein [Candidatus Latescibacterota bacterium]